MSTSFDARAELMNLGQLLVNEGRFKKTRCATALQFTQCNDTWNCIHCGIDGVTAAIPYYNGEAPRLSVGVRTKATPAIMFSSAFCISCVRNLKQSATKTDQVIFEMLSRYYEEHRYHATYGLGNNWPVPSPLRQSKTKAPPKPSAGGKAKGRVRGSRNASKASFSFIEDEASQSFAAPSEYIPIMQENQSNDNQVTAIEIGTSKWAELFEIPISVLNEATESLTAKASDSQNSPNNVPAEMPSSYLFQFPKLLLEDITNPVDQEFNFDLLKYFDDLVGQMGNFTAPSDGRPIYPEKFLLLGPAPSESEIVDLLHCWINFVLFFLHQCKANEVAFLSFSGEPAFFELQDVPTFTAQSVNNHEFHQKILEFTNVLKARGKKAQTEERELQRTVTGYFSSAIEFSELFCFILDPTFCIRKEARLFSRYFFRFPDRLRSLYNFDAYHVLSNLQAHDIGGYKSSGTVFVPNLTVNPKHHTFTMKVITNNGL